MRILSITGIAAVALLSSGLVSDASAQGRGRGQDQNRARGLDRARQVASLNSRILRNDNSRLGRISDDGDSDGRKVRKNKKNKGNCDRRNGDVIGRTGTTLPSGVCVDSNGDGICDSGTGADQRRPRTGSGAAGVILGRRASGSVLARQVGLALLQRYAYQQAAAYQQRVAYGQRGLR
jgi:hypothetical protein